MRLPNMPRATSLLVSLETLLKCRMTTQLFAVLRSLPLAAVCLFGTAATVDATILAVSSAGRVYSIDEFTGAATHLTSTGLNLNAMAKDASGTIYVAGTAVNELGTLNPATGAYTAGPIINLGGTTVAIRALAFSPSGMLYAINNPLSATTSQLYIVDTTTGVGTLVGTVPGAIQAMEFSPAGTLYGWEVLAISGSGIGLGLVVINPATAALTDVNPAVNGTLNEVQTIAFSPSGDAYGARSNLYTIDLATGALTFVAAIAIAPPHNDIRGMEFIAGLPPMGPGVSLSPTSLAFGSQLLGTTSATQTITLLNSGTAALTITSIAVTGDFTQNNSCPATLAPAASCAINITFTPAVVGARSGTLNVISNAPTSPDTAALSGNGVATPPPPSGPPAEIPTLSDWTLWVLTGVLLVTAIGSLRKRGR